MSPALFQNLVVEWYQRHGRNNLPWQNPTTPYRTWLSEVMLQQTQVATVIPYFNQFMKRFPDIHQLAQASSDEVLELWAGLGYYSRARNLHKTAQIISHDYEGKFPADLEALMALPGVGRSTAGAILALSMNKAAPILDGNVKRVLTRLFRIQGWPENTAVKKQLWQLAEQYTPERKTREYTQAMMDIGAIICTRNNPTCNQCPLSQYCEAHQYNEATLYPERKPRSEKLTKEICLLLIENSQNQLLLEKRPPTGIWGGLWSFPETQNLKTLPQKAEELGFAIKKQKVLPRFRHTFTHFHLNITPVLLNIKPLDNVAASTPELSWHDTNAAGKGVPKPTQKLLNQYQQGDLTWQE